MNDKISLDELKFRVSLCQASLAKVVHLYMTGVFDESHNEAWMRDRIVECAFAYVQAKDDLALATLSPRAA